MCVENTAGVWLMLRVCGNSTYIHTKPLYMGVAQPRSYCLIIYKIPAD